jgi:tetratricopeptide (TPR) repeat protein
MSDNPRIDELRRRVEKDPTSIAFAQLAEECRRTGDYAEAVKVCREGLARHPGYISAQVTLGRALMELNQFDEACTELEAVMQAAPDNLAAIRALAEIHQRRGDAPESIHLNVAPLETAPPVNVSLKAKLPTFAETGDSGEDAPAMTSEDLPSLERAGPATGARDTDGVSMGIRDQDPGSHPRRRRRSPDRCPSLPGSGATSWRCGASSRGSSQSQ